jgi:hypothetical protein
VDRVAVVEDLKYSVILAAGPEAAADEAAAAREAHWERAVLVWVSFVPVQSDWTACRSARAWKERRLLAAEGPSMEVVRELVLKAMGSAASVVVFASAA